MASRDLTRTLPVENPSIDISDGFQRQARRGLFGGFGFLAVWWLLAGTVPAYLLPSPVAVLSAFVTELT
ncbi:MAG: hypothetical protein V5A65_09740, partial [Halodesulfurarchaeum sp.]